MRSSYAVAVLCRSVAVFLLASSVLRVSAADLLIDTDMLTDCDDVAALELAYACERKGDARVLAVTVSSSYPKSVPVVEAVNAFCGRADLPVGAPKNGTGYRRDDSCFLDKVAAEFPHRHESNDEAPGAVEVMRRTLAAAPDGSVTLVTLGYLSNVAALLKSGPDAISPLDGRALLSRKVKEWACMGGNFPNDPAKDNVNFTRDAPAAVFALTNYPGRITFVGREIGHRIFIGDRFHGLPAANPLRRAYELHRGRFGTNWDHHTADPTTILYAVYGSGERFGRVEGTLHLQPNCAFRWDPSRPSNMTYLTQREPRAETALAMERLLLADLTAAASRPGAEFDLSGIWRLTQADKPSVSCPVRVPGGIYTALLDAKIIPDPFFAQNERLTQWPGRVEWDFTRTFGLSRDVVDMASVILRLEDVDCFADIYLNGGKVGSTGNRFQRYDFDVKPFLRPGANDLRVRFHSTELVSCAETNRYDRTFNIANATVRNINLVRTVQCHGGWDWGITQMETGLMGVVKLVAVDEARLDYVYTAQSFAEDYSSVDVAVTAEVFAPQAGETDFAVRLGEIERKTRVALKAGANTLVQTVTVERPRLWWPNECGAQELYDLAVSVGSSVLSRRLGLRKVEIINDLDAVADPVDGKKGRQMTVAVNGKRIFCKGADWIPCDAFENRQAGRYRQHLEDVRDSHMNMVRVWGGGQFERTAFYRLCDELGIMIWHDLMFSCATYPGSAEFLSGVEKEVVHQLKRLRDHASIVLWCGDNECIGAAGWFGEREKPGRYEENLRLCAERAKFLDGVCRRTDPTRVFWPSSPSLGPGNFGDAWSDDSSGDMHFWDVWFGGALFSRYYGIRPRFCSEFGFQSYPSVETALTYVTPDQLNPTAPDFHYHQKSPNGNKFILETMMTYFRFPKGVKAVHYLSQVQQAVAIRTGVEHFRRIMPRCMGSIYWQLCDNWPVASWSSIEYGGKWKHLQYHAKRFYAPCVVSMGPAYGDPNTLELWAVNDKDEPLIGAARLETWTFDGAIAGTKTFALDVPPRSARRLGSFPVDAFGAEEERRGRFLALSADGCPDNEWQFGFYREANLTSARVKAELTDENGVWAAVLTTDKPALFVWADVPGIRGVFSDNSFTLLPGRPRRLTFRPRAGEPATFGDFKRVFETMHLRESYE